MSEEEINIAIAETRGWELRPYGDMLVWYNPEGHACPVERDHRNKCLPNHFKDLNAMREAVEKVLNEDQKIDYSRHVGKLVMSHLPASRAAWMDFGLINATAAQRAEAFLRTIGKWKE